MNLLWLVLSCVTLTSATITIKNGSFSTAIDHFNPANSRKTVQFTYYVNDEWRSIDGPIFIYVKEIGDLSIRWIEEGHMVDIARQTNGTLFTFNHRYFGENRPTENTTFENLQFLSLNQALADIATLADYAKSSESKVILWGSGYGATLAALTRIKYPHLIDGAWSSSGIFDNQIANTGPHFSLLLTLQLHEQNNRCRDRAANAFNSINTLVIDGQAEQLQELLNLCSPVLTDSENDTSALYEHLYDRIIQQLNEFHLQGLNDFCGDILEGDNELESFSNWLNKTYLHGKCLDHSYATIIAENVLVNYNSTTGKRQSYYLQCTQLANFRVTYTQGLLLPIPFDYYESKCHDVFNVTNVFIDLIYSLNALAVHHGKSTQNVTNIIFTNGQLDVNLYDGIIAAARNAYVIQDYAKSGDLRSISANDTDELVQIKQEIKRQILTWIQSD